MPKLKTHKGAQSVSVRLPQASSNAENRTHAIF